MTNRLIWLGPEFTPYHETLFRAIVETGSVELQVAMMMGPTTSHPFEPPSKRPYEWRLADPFPRIDYELISWVLSQTDAMVLVSSYLQPTLMAAMKALVRNGRTFLFHSDTPLPQGIEWNSGVRRRRSLPRRLARMSRLKWIYKNAHRVLMTGRPGVKAAIDLGCPPGKVVNFPYWVDTETIIPSSEVRDGPVRFIGVGGLIHRKAYDLAIRAYRLALDCRELEGSRFLLVGDGPEREKLEVMSRELGVEAHVDFLGWRKPEEVRDILREADVFVHPARWEPYGVSVLEAMSSGLPVLGSDSTCAVLDRVVSGVMGYIHRTEDYVQLANHMMRVAQDREHLRKMGRVARQRAVQWPPALGARTIEGIMKDCP